MHQSQAGRGLPRPGRVPAALDRYERARPELDAAADAGIAALRARRAGGRS